MKGRTPCLILACGNPLRSDDGVGPSLCAWAADKFNGHPEVRAIARQQWTPELAQDIAAAKSVLFLDCSIESAAGAIKLSPVQPAAPAGGLAAHYTGAPELLHLAKQLYGKTPRASLLLTIGADSTELGEGFSPAVEAALPGARELLGDTIREILRG
jgi:hydrogenase maturation protease